MIFGPHVPLAFHQATKMGPPPEMDEVEYSPEAEQSLGSGSPNIELYPQSKCSFCQWRLPVHLTLLLTRLGSWMASPLQGGSSL